MEEYKEKKGKGYKYSDTRAKEIFDASRETVSIFPKERVYKDLIEMSIKELKKLTLALLVRPQGEKHIFVLLN